MQPVLILLPVIIYSVFLCRLIFVVKGRRKKGPSSNGRPAGAVFISVVVACRNEEKNIAALLDSLCQLNYPAANLEIIIVDDNSADETVSVINEFIRQHQANIRLINNQLTGKKSAIFTGVKESSGELIIVTDADCAVSPGWVASYESVFRSKSPDLIAGRVICKAGNSFVSSFGKYEFAALQGVTEAMILAGNPVMSNGANMAFRKETYMNHAGELRVDIASGDDVFLLHAIKNTGGKICWNDDPASVVTTAGVSTLRGLMRQRARWASKATHYTDTATILTAAMVFMSNIALLCLYTGSVFSSSFLYLLPVAFALKALTDGIIINHVLFKEKKKFSLPLFLIMDILYPVYFILVFVLALFPSMKRFASR